LIKQLCLLIANSPARRATIEADSQASATRNVLAAGVNHEMSGMLMIPFNINEQ
jgi:hypothetical protein